VIHSRDVLKFVAHGRYVQRLARAHGWRPGARYTNLRDVRGTNFAGNGFLDIEWRKYNFERHLDAAKSSRPFMTVARDVEDIFQLDRTLAEAEKLQRYATLVVIVPKDPRLSKTMESLIPRDYILGFSVPTKYGGTPIAPKYFKRRVHLLGGRPDRQRELAEQMDVFSVDCNRFTLDARFGDFFDGRRFRPHPIGGYEKCLLESMRNIDALWKANASARQVSCK